MIKRLIATVLATGALIHPLAATAQITVEKNVHISAARPDIFQGEIAAEIDPRRPGRMIVCSHIMNPSKRYTRSEGTGIVAYMSSDGGKTWRHSFEEYPFGDPVCTFGVDGSAYVMGFTMRADTSGMPLWRSTDDGKTWKVASLTHGMDREFITVDRTGGKYHGYLYIYGQFASRTEVFTDPGHDANGIKMYASSDSGRSWHDPITAATPEPNRELVQGQGVVLSDGTLVIPFNEIRFYRQPDGTFQIPPNSHGQPTALLRVITSTDGGNTLNHATTVSDYYMNAYPWKPIESSIVPWLAVDTTHGVFRDRLYITWTDRRSGRDEVMFSFSKDKGKTWSAPRVVNDDRPPATLGKGPDHMLPIVTVNKDGVVGMMWYDRREHPDNLGWDIRFTASLDGGESFLPSVKVSEKPQGPIAKGLIGAMIAKGSPDGAPTNVTIHDHGHGISGGDTGGMPADADGSFHPVWTDNRTGINQLYTARVVVAATAATYGSSELAGMKEVSDKLKLEISDMAYDRRTGNVSARAWITNASKEDLNAPITVRVVNFGSDIGVAEITNADNGQRGVGGIWKFVAPAQALVLRPNQTTDPRTLTFKLRDVRPYVTGTVHKSKLVDLDVRIFVGR
jgi:hypothetical protein